MTPHKRACVRVLASRYRAGENALGIGETARVVGQALGISSQTAALVLRELLDAGYLRVVAELSGQANLVVEESIVSLEAQAEAENLESARTDAAASRKPWWKFW